MSSSASDDRSARQGPQREVHEGSPGAGPQPPELLKSVLEQTFRRWRTKERMEPAELQAVLDVARRHRGLPFSLEPVTVDLVHAVLQRDFKRMTPSAESWTELVNHVAQTLYDDEVSHDRLRGLWAQLTEVQP